MFSCHLEIFKQRKNAERNKDLPSGWMTGRKDRGEGGAIKIFSFLNPPPNVKHADVTSQSNQAV